MAVRFSIQDQSALADSVSFASQDNPFSKPLALLNPLDLSSLHLDHPAEILQSLD